MAKPTAQEQAIAIGTYHIPPRDLHGSMWRSTHTWVKYVVKLALAKISIIFARTGDLIGCHDIDHSKKISVIKTTVGRV